MSGSLLFEILIPLLLTVTFGAVRALFRSQNSRFEDFVKGIEKLDEQILNLSHRLDDLTGRLDRHLDNHK